MSVSQWNSHVCCESQPPPCVPYSMAGISATAERNSQLARTMNSIGPNPNPNPHALATAQAAQAQLPDASVILFGSRATGQHGPDSDIDLLIVTSDHDPLSAEIRARKAALTYLKAHPPRVPVDAIGINRTQFERCSKANQHIAGQAIRYGVIMSGDNLGHASSSNDGNPDHWSETRRRIERAQAWNQSLADVIDNQHQELVGFTAQQAVESALKGWLSAFNDVRTFGHDLTELWDDIKDIEAWNSPDLSRVAEAANDLFNFTQYRNPGAPDEYKDWLTDYAATYRYSGTAHNMTAEERRDLQQLMDQFVTAVVARIHRLSGTGQSDV